MNKLEQLTSKIHELLKGTVLDPMELKVGCIVFNDLFDEPQLIFGINDKFIYTCSTEGTKIYPKPLPKKNILGSPIKEAELFVALQILCDSHEDWHYELDIELFGINHRHIEIARSVKESNKWDWEKWVLGKSLNEQPEETINFLHQIFCDDK